MDIKSILGDVLGVAGKVTGIGLLNDAASALKGADISPEKQAEIRDSLFHHEEVIAAIESGNLKIGADETIAMISSSDKWTSRARPTAIYAATGITVMIGVALCWCLVNKIAVDMGAIGAILSLLTPLWTNSIWYTNSRTKEKIAGA